MLRRLIHRPLALLTAAALFFTLFGARPARADDTALIATISSGAVAAVLLIAIIGTRLTDDGDDELGMLLQEHVTPSQHPGQERGLQFGARCPQQPVGALAVCW